MRLLITLTITVLLTSYVKAGCFLGQYSEECKYRHLFDFGPNAGDEDLAKLDDHYVLVKKPINFKFYDKYFQAFYISTNGVIQLVEKNESFNLHDTFHYNSEVFPIENHTLIAPFWADMFPDVHGDVFYRLVSDNGTLNEVAYEVDKLTRNIWDASFKPAWAAIITWYQMKAFNHRRFEYNNTFQVILTTDGSESYVIFNYGRLNWPNEKVKVGVEAGFNLGDGQTFHQMEETFTHNITELEYKSNVGLRSKWVFRVDKFKNTFDQKSISKKNHFLDIHDKQTCKYRIIQLSILVIIFSLHMLLTSAYYAWKYIKRQRFRPRLQMRYQKQINESTMGLNSQDI